MPIILALPTAIGSRPKTVVKVVMRMGRKRCVPASTRASKRSTPLARRRLAISMSTMALLTTTPTRITVPMPESISNGVFVKYSVQ